MNTKTFEDLAEKLKYAPSSILEKIWADADALLENKELAFTLTKEQKKNIDRPRQYFFGRMHRCRSVLQRIERKI
jgi:hypothetical protein